MFRTNFIRTISAVILAAVGVVSAKADEPPSLVHVEAFSAPEGFTEGLERHIKFHPRYALDPDGSNSRFLRFAVVFMKDKEDLAAVPDAYLRNSPEVLTLLRALSNKDWPSINGIAVRINGKTVNVSLVNLEEYRTGLRRRVTDLSDEMLTCVFAGEFFAGIFSTRETRGTHIARCEFKS